MTRKSRKHKAPTDTSSSGHATICDASILEAYKKSASDLRWALRILVTLFFCTCAYMLWKDNKEYEIAVQEVEKKLQQTKEMVGEIDEIAAQINNLRDNLQSDSRKFAESINSQAKQMIKQLNENAINPK